MAPRVPQPSALEMQILSVLWEKGPSTVRTVLEALSHDKPRAYTTILSTMQVMEKKKLLRRDGTVSGALVYKPSVTVEQVRRPALRQLFKNLFGGSPSAVLQQLLAEGPVEQEELSEIQRLIDEARQHEQTKSPARKRGPK